MDVSFPEKTAIVVGGSRGSGAAICSELLRGGRRVAFTCWDSELFHMPFGSPDEVRQQVLENLRILGAGGGYILAPCHNLQAITPVENILAMYETGYAEGWK